MNKKKITFLILSITSLALVYVFILRTQDIRNTSELNKTENGNRKEKITNNETNMKLKKNKNWRFRDEKFVLKKEKNFNQKSLREIKNCRPQFTGIKPSELLEDIPLDNNDFFHHKVNIHFKTKKGNTYQIRKEIGLNSSEVISYSEKNGLPNLIKFSEINEVLIRDDITYREDRRILKNELQSLEAILIDNEIIKIDYTNKKATLSCDLFEKNWECLCEN